MSFHKSENGMPIYLEICPKNVTYNELENDVECFFTAILSNMTYHFKAAWPKDEPMDIFEGKNYIVLCRLIEAEGQMVLFVNSAGILEKSITQSSQRFNSNQNDFENYYPSKDEKKEETISLVSPFSSTPVEDITEAEDLPSEEISTSAAIIAESDPNCETKVNEVEYQAPQQCDADELTY